MDSILYHPVLAACGTFDLASHLSRKFPSQILRIFLLRHLFSSAERI